MKKLIMSMALLSLLAACKKSAVEGMTDCSLPECINGHYRKADTLNKLVKQYIEMGIPGLAVAIYADADGYWGTAGGYADVETKTPMQLTHLQYLQSVSKTYMAAAILKLREEGKINLDAPMTDYLPQMYQSYIDQASTMTVRNLLNHTSGMPDYLENPSYTDFALQHPGHIFTSEEFLGYIKGTPRRFEPGSKFDYSNTNYHILALIADAVSGSHEELIRQKILAPLRLTHTCYRNINGLPNLVSSYIDLQGNGDLQNISLLQQSSITSAKGDDGIVATPLDAIGFLKGLTEKKILSAASLNEMMAWVKDAEGKPVYGMGLYHVVYNDVTGYGHGGSGAGAGCGLYYFPSKHLYVFLGTNIGTLVDGPLVQKVGELKSRLMEVILTD